MQLIPITDLSCPALQAYTILTENQLLSREHPEEGLFIAESPKVVARALDAGCVPLSALVEARLTEEPVTRAILERCGEIPIYTAPFEVLSRLTGFPLTRGLLCAMHRPRLRPWRELCAGKSRIAVLERVMNPTNVGAIFRSAAALGMEAVLLTPDCSDPLYRRAIRVSMGTVFQVPWAFLPDPALLKEAGFATAALALREDSISLRDPRLRQLPRLALLLGSEGDGLSPQTLTACDYVIRIPMAPQVDSLNVAAASAVAFWELGKAPEPLF